MNAPRLPSPEEGFATGLLPHLVELRSRLVQGAAALAVIVVALMPWANKLYAWLAGPMVAHLPKGAHMIATEVVTPFSTPVKLTVYVAVFVSMPILLYQVWAFVRPGLYHREARLARPLLVASLALFYAGCAFAWLIVLPAAVSFLAGTTPAGVTMMTDIAHYLDFVMVMCLSFGLCFQVPVAVVVLAASGLVDAAKLRGARSYAFVGAFAIAAFMTPPDLLSMFMLAIPMCLLYEAGLVAVRILL